LSEFITIQFMTTEGCHLCEQAWAMLSYLQRTQPEFMAKFELSKVEISDSDSLVERYGIRIPVLVAQRDELGWPFELEEVLSWLSAC
jgi:glutaredoxin